MADYDSEKEGSFESDLLTSGDLFFETPEDDDLFKDYTNSLYHAKHIERIDLIEAEFDTLENGSDLPDDPELAHIYKKLKTVFAQLLPPDYKPKPKGKDNGSEAQQQSLFGGDEPS